MQKSILVGTITLACANFISKILGAILKIPLTYILGESGMAIYHSAFSVYVTVLMLTTSGFPFAVSKFISESLATKSYGNIKKALRLSLIIMSSFGISGSLVLYFGADFFACALKDPDAAMSIRAIAPSVFFVATGCVYKSLFEAYSNMLPTAMSQVSESLIKLIFGYLLSLVLSRISLMHASCGAVGAITIGEAIATLLLFLMSIPYTLRIKHTVPTSDGRDILRKISEVALPLMAISVISGCFSVLETSVIKNALTKITFSCEDAVAFLSRYSPYTDVFSQIAVTGRMDIDGARWLFGAYTGYAQTVFNLPVGVFASFTIPLLPVITKNSALGKTEKSGKTVGSVMRMVIILSLPCTVIMLLCPDYILGLLFKNTASAGLLCALSVSLPVICLSTITASSLYASGKMLSPFLADTIASLIGLIIICLTVPLAKINIYGVIIASFLSNIVALSINLTAGKKHLKICFPPVSFVAKAILSAAAMGCAVHILCDYLDAFKSGFIIASAVGLMVYFLLIYLFGMVTKKEIIF